MANRHSFVVVETSLPAEGTVAEYRRSRVCARPARVPVWAWVTVLVLVCLAVVPAAAKAALVGEWTLDEGAGQVVHDRAQPGEDGHLGLADGADGADPAWVPGIAGWALRFDGGDAVVLRDSPALEPANVTIEAWVRRRGTPGAYAYIVSKGSLGCDFSSYGLYSGAGRGVAFYVSDGDGYAVSPAAAPSQVWDGAWHHVAGTFDGQRVRLYLDGSQVGDGSSNERPIQYGLHSRAAYIGSYQGSCALGFTGDIDDVRIWSSALTAQQVAASRPTQPVASGGPTAGPAAPGPAPPQAQLPPVAGPPPAAVTTCVVTTNRKAVRAGRPNRLLVAVRRDARRLRHVRVLVSGRRLRLVRRAGRDGRARIVVRPRLTERRLRIRALGSASRCAAASLPVRR